MADIDNISIGISADVSKATSALDNLVRKLDTLSSALGNLNATGLNNLSNGINTLTSAMAGFKTTDIKQADFTRIATGLKALEKVNAGHLSALASSLTVFSTTIGGINSMSNGSRELASAAKVIAHLGYGTVTKSISNMQNVIPVLNQFAVAINGFNTNVVDTSPIVNLAHAMSQLGGANSQRAIITIPQLGTALSQLMTTLSRAPQVSANVINMTNALARLAAEGGKVGTAATRLQTSLNRVNSSTKNTTKSMKSLAFYFGKMYANFFLFIRAFRLMWKSVSAAMSYLEVLNYFKAAMKQVAAKADLGAWEELGYKSAEEYYDALTSGITTMLGKMTGFQIGEDGRLVTTDMTSLGLDPTKLMNFSAQFAQMASSMGVASEYANKLSVALTEIGADLASVKNLNFEKVWGDMASGMVGMSRTLDKYGVNIRNANLNTELLKLGIDTTVNKLGQNDKALLRTIVLLDSTRFAWGDLANTINRPANSLRVMKAAFSNLSREIGNIFMPIVAKVIPYLTAFANALSGVARYIVELLGFTGFDWGGGVGGDSDLISDIMDDAEDTADALGTATDNAKKLKQQLLGLDELNVLTTKDDSSGGKGDAISATAELQSAFDKIFDEYQKRWDEAFNNILHDSENNAKSFLGKISSALTPLTKSLGNLWNRGLKPLKEFQFGVLLDFYNDFLVPVGSWVLSEDGIPRLIDAFADFLSKINWDKLRSSLDKVFKALGKFTIGIGKGFIDFTSGLLELLSPAVNILIEGFALALEGVTNVINSISETTLKAIGGALGGLLTALLAYKGIQYVAYGVELVVYAFKKLVYFFQTNPFTVAIGALGAMAGALIAFDKAGKEAASYNLDLDEMGKFGDTLTNLSNQNVDMAQSFLEASKTRRDSLSNISSVEIPTIQALADQYFNLANKTNLSEEEYAQMRLAAENLVDYFPEIASFYDETTGKIDMERQSIETLIETRKKDLELRAIEASYGDAIKQQIEQRKNLAEQNKLLAEAEQEVNEKANAYKQLELEMAQNTSPLFFWSHIEELEMLGNEADEAVNRYNEIVESYYTISEAAQQADEDVQYYQEMYAKTLSGAAEKTAQNMNGIGRKTVENLTQGMFEAGGGQSSKVEGVGKNLVKGVAQGIGRNSSEAENAMSDMGKDMITALEKETEIHSPSKKTYRDGQFIVEGLRLGINDSKKSLTVEITKWTQDLLKVFQEWSRNIGNVLSNGLANAFADSITSVKKLWNAFANDFNEKMQVKIEPLVVEGKQLFAGQQIQFANIPTYKTGGFPEDGFFMANHTEMVGQFSNGRTAVANNAQIVDGISYGVQRAVETSLAPYLADIARNTNEMATKDIEVSTNGIFKSVRNSARTYQKSTGQPAFNF